MWECLLRPFHSFIILTISSLNLFFSSLIFFPTFTTQLFNSLRTNRRKRKNSHVLAHNCLRLILMKILLQMTPWASRGRKPAWLRLRWLKEYAVVNTQYFIFYVWCIFYQIFLYLVLLYGSSFVITLKSQSSSLLASVSILSYSVRTVHLLEVTTPLSHTNDSHRSNTVFINIKTFHLCLSL